MALTTLAVLVSPSAAASDPQELASAVIAEVNARRAEVGGAPVVLSGPLCTAARAHAEYLVANASLWDKGLDAHYEQAGYIGYYAWSPYERAKKAGADLRLSVYEDVIRSTGGSTLSAAFLVGAWINAPLHRRAIIDRAITEAGFGWATDGLNSAYVYDAAYDRNASSLTTDLQEYPADGMTGVPVGWDGNEIPQPFPPSQYPSLWNGAEFIGGYPITFFATLGSIEDLAFSLSTAGGAVVPVLRSAQYPHVFAPERRLLRGTTYCGRVTYTIRDNRTGFLISGEKTFRFTTAGSETSTTTSSSTSTITTTVPSTTTTTLPSTTTTTVPTTTTTTTVPPAPSFPDVRDHPYAAAIEGLAALGVVHGYDDGGVRWFGPDRTLTRAQFAKILVLALGISVSTRDECPFGDVPRTQGDELYPDHYIAAAWREGLVKGTSLSPPRFSPDQSLTRAQLLTLVVRAGRLLAGQRLREPDPDWYGSLRISEPEHSASARWAEFNGLLDGIEIQGGWNLWSSASRGEAAQVVWNLVK